MLLPGTQMHIVTFLFICIEIVILFYLLIYKLARPDDKTTFLNIILISLLILYNLTGGLLPDNNLPGSYFTQMTLAYATGFITPCYFPFYVYKAFDLVKMRFHAYKGVFACILFPYVLFVLVFAYSGKLDDAKNILIIPLLYSIWVIYSLNKAVRFKYNDNFSTVQAKQERFILLLSLTPWVGLPVIDYFNAGQAIEASFTNLGFLTLFAFHVKQHIKAIRLEHERLTESEKQLMNWNNILQTEVEKRTKELATINEQQMNTFVNLAHETKTPLTLINNYMADYIARNGSSEELMVVKSNLNKLSADIINLFDLEKFKRGFEVYNNDQVCDFSQSLRESLTLFELYAGNKNITLHNEIEGALYVKADPLAINRIINNLVENAIKYSSPRSAIIIKLSSNDHKIFFSVQDFGPGIPLHLQAKVFEPYFQIKSRKQNIEGMGLGLPIAKKVANELGGNIRIYSNPEEYSGTTVEVVFPEYLTLGEERPVTSGAKNTIAVAPPVIVHEHSNFDNSSKYILVVEDNPSMLDYLVKKLKTKHNVLRAINGSDALRMISESSVLPDLIISDVMMDKLDGYSFAEIISKNPRYNHIPIIFLSAKSTMQDKLRGLKVGAIDFIQKPFSIEELLQKAETILNQAENQQKAVLNNVLNSLRQHHLKPETEVNEDVEEHYNQYGLSLRERDIAKLVCKGVKYSDIGKSLFISEKTVAKHVQNIFKKVKVSNRIELIKKLNC